MGHVGVDRSRRSNEGPENGSKEERSPLNRSKRPGNGLSAA